jgi:hypothetical protein
MRRSVLATIVVALLGTGCAGQVKSPVPTTQMAQASMAVHRAHQSSCRRYPDGLALYEKAEHALDASRKRVRAGDNEQAKQLANQALFYARQALAVQTQMRTEQLVYEHEQADPSTGGERPLVLETKNSSLFGAPQAALAP